MKKLWILLLGAALMTSCADKGTDELDSGSGSGSGDDNVEITITPTGTANVYTLSTNSESTNLTWDLGKDDGKTVSGNNVEAKYPYKGTYTIKLTYQAESYEFESVTKELVVEADNLDLLDPEVILLTGGSAFPNGKTWVFDAAEEGHIANGEDSKYVPNPDWYVASPFDKEESGIYDNKVIFKLDGYGFTLDNEGLTLAAGEESEAEMTARGGVLTNTPGDEYADRVYEYTPGSDWTWEFTTTGDKNYIEFPENEGFMIYFTPGPHKYEILEITENTLYLRQELAGKANYFMFIQEGYERPAQEEVVSFEEDFEVAESLNAVFIGLMSSNEGVTLTCDAANPDDSAENGNDSAKVAEYVRTGALEWSASSYYVDPETPFDLSVYNRISMKVYIPSTNDYTGALTREVVLRFRDNSLEGDAWKTEVAVKQTVSEEDVDKWITLNFNLSAAAGLTDRDLFQIQFGGDGHDNTGTFYFDDFKFYGLKDVDAAE